MRKLAFILGLGLALVLILGACGGGSDTDEPAEPAEPAAPVGDATAGKGLYDSTCAACHGPDAKGLPGLGKDLTTSEFAIGKSDSELADFIRTGRSVGDPENTTGVDMPPRGGNPALNDDQILDIIAYVRTLEE